MYKKECKFCGKIFMTKSKLREYCTKVCRLAALKQRCDEYGQPCFLCKNAIGGCSWSDSFIPVRGWDAEPTIIKDSEIGDIPSFKIKHCPQFVCG